jgi:hypothetical protein
MKDDCVDCKRCERKEKVRIEFLACIKSNTIYLIPKEFDVVKGKSVRVVIEEV